MNNVPEPQQCDAIECGTYDNGLWLECDTCHEMHKAQWQQLQQKNERLRAALQTYGRHSTPDICCEASKSSDRECNCGFNQALKGDE